MIHQTRGIVFKTIKFSETSVVSKIYTERFGMQSYLVNGVRSPKAKVKASLLQSLSLLDMEVYYRENKNLNRIKELRPAHIFSSLPFSIVKGAVGLFMIEVLYKSIREEESNVQLFEFIFKKIKALDEVKNVAPDFILRFLLDLSSYLGFFPNGEFSELTPQFDLKEGTFASSVNHPYLLGVPYTAQLSALIKNQFLEMTAPSRRKLLDALLQYYQLHVPNFSHPKSLRVLDEVFRN